MPLFVWNQSYSVNVKQCDEQHQKLFAIINELFDAMSTGKAKDALNAIVDRLAAYTATHFRAEEQILRQVKYPHLATQESEHRKFEAQVAKFKKEMELSGSTSSADVLDFLKEWLTKHIRQVDHQYAAYVNERGIS
jgi:hemerythrin